MAIQFGVKEILTEVGKYGFGIVTGTGITLASLLAWTGTEDLEAIRQQFSIFESSAETQVNEAVSQYSQVVVDANAEIGEYQKALEQANSNISQLITAYESKQAELTTKEQELENLQTQLKQNYVSVDEVNEVITKANAEIGQANQDVADLKSDIENYVEYSMVSDGSYLQNKLDNVEVELDTTGDKSVTSIEDIVPSEQQGE